MTETRPQKLEINVTTGEEILMDMTDEEIAELETARAAWAEEDARATAAAEALTVLKASAKAKLVAGQPLTEEEAATLII